MLGALVLLLAACGADTPEGDGSSPDYDRALAGARPKLERIYDQPGELLEGGVDAFRRRIDSLRGYPVVVNKWASWCGPCRTELPFFQSQVAKRGKRVAFLGLNSNDGGDAAREFIRDFPVPYPSYVDPKLELAKEIEAVQEFPATGFFDSDGDLVFTHRGVYVSERQLARDIRKYAR